MRRAVRERLDELLDGNRVLCLPTAPGPAPLKGEAPDVVEDTRKRVLCLTSIAGLAGLPQVSLPLGWMDGCPVGISLIARRGRDEMLLALTRTIADAVTSRRS